MRLASALGPIRRRVVCLAAVAALPLVVVAVSLTLRLHDVGLDLAGVLGAWVIGLLIVRGGANGLVVRPLKQLAHTVDHWREGGPFSERSRIELDRMPVEVAELFEAFSHAAAALAEHERQLQVVVSQQELLMQEIHHRVKNNLQIVASLLNLQASRIRQPEARAAFQSARDRVHALATLHRHLYVEGELRAINMRSFLTELCGQLFQAMGEREGERIQLTVEAPELQMSSDQAVPLSLIVTEAVSNAIKYAFPGGAGGHVSVRLTAETDVVRLVIEDDGIGIPAGRGESETGPRDGLGMQLIRGFSRQIGAQLTVREGQGTRYEVVVPLGHEQRDHEVERSGTEAA